jgi:hypothetical protein
LALLLGFFPVQYELIIQVKHLIVCFLNGRNELLWDNSRVALFPRYREYPDSVFCVQEEPTAHEKSILWPLLEYGT